MTTSQHIEDFGELAPATDDGKVVVAGGGGRVHVFVVAVAGRQVAAKFRPDAKLDDQVERCCED